MAFENKYENFLNKASIIADSASENLLQGSVWLQHVLRQAMPTGTQNVQVRKKGKLGRKILPENTAYSYDASSEYTETFTLLNAIKAVVISKLTIEAERFAFQDAPSVIGEEQGKALALGMEQDIASLAVGFSSVVTAAATTGAINLDLQACAYAIRTATNGHGTRNKVVAVLSPTTAFRIGVKDIIAPTGSFGMPTTYARDGGSFNNILEKNGGGDLPNGYMATIGGIDVYTTNVIDDSSSKFVNLVFDPSRAIVGMWDDSVTTKTDLDIEYVLDKMASIHFSDFAMHWNEAGCQLLDPITTS